MNPKHLHWLTPPVLTILTVVVSLFWIGQAVAGEQIIRVYKNPT